MDCRTEAVRMIKEKLSDKEAEILQVFITGLWAARTVKDYPQSQPPPNNQPSQAASNF